MDVDEVLAELHEPWLAWGNRRFGTAHTAFSHWDAPTDWWGADAYAFLTPRIYLDGTVRVAREAGPVLSLLRSMGHQVTLISTCHSDDVAVAKQLWCALWVGDCPFVSSANKVDVPGIDILVDDGFHNLLGYGSSRGILMARPHNATCGWSGATIRNLVELPGVVYNWPS